MCFVFCRINPYGLVQMAEAIVGHMKNKNEAIEFLNKLREKVKICDEAVWYIQVQQYSLKFLPIFSKFFNIFPLITIIPSTTILVFLGPSRQHLSNQPGQHHRVQEDHRGTAGCAGGGGQRDAGARQVLHAGLPVLPACGQAQ